MAITYEQLANWFTYHAPEGKVAGMNIDKVTAYQLIRDAGQAFAHAVVACTPACADQTVAVQKIREAVMVANQSIACDGL